MLRQVQVTATPNHVFVPFLLFLHILQDEVLDHSNEAILGVAMECRARPMRREAEQTRHLADSTLLLDVQPPALGGRGLAIDLPAHLALHGTTWCSIDDRALKLRTSWSPTTLAGVRIMRVRAREVKADACLVEWEEP